MAVSDEKEEGFLKEYYDSAMNLVVDRVSSPLIFSFVISWLITNFKVIMVLFTDESESFIFEYKIKLITTYLGDIYSWIIPLIAALFYTFFYPYVDRLIKEFTLNRKLDLRKDKNRLMENEMRTAEEVKEIHVQHYKIEKDLELEIARLKQRESQLAVVIESLEEEASEFKQVSEFKKDKGEMKVSNKKLKPNQSLALTQSDFAVLKSIGNKINKDKTTYIDKEKMSLESNMDKITVDLSVANLLYNELINSNGEYVNLTTEGMAKFQAISKDL